MKKYISGLILALAFAVISPEIAFGQWDMRDDILYNIVLERANRRKTEAKIKARRGGRRTATTRRRGGAQKTAPAAVEAPAKLWTYGIKLERGSDFYYRDLNGFLVKFIFTSVATGKTTLISEQLTLYNSDNPSIDELAVGVYTVTATAVYKGKTYPVHLGTEVGTEDNPTGGDFAPSIRVESKREVDNDGETVIRLYPQKMYVQVIE